MNYFNLGKSDLEVSNIGLGCMRMAGKSLDEAKEIVKVSIDSGINFFDHADIYGKGESEVIFGQAVKSLGIDRESIIVQSKCGIRDGMFDFSKEHIISSVMESLKRLQMDYLDVLVLHRPDTLFDPLEVNAAFKHLHSEGIVRNFGVSNQNPYQIELLKTELEFPILTNQVQFSIRHTPMIDAGFNVNMKTDAAVGYAMGILEHARMNGITLQAWSPFYSGHFEEIFLDNPKFEALNELLTQIGIKYGVAKDAIAVSWILTHPAQMQVLIGSMTTRRINSIAKGSEIVLTRSEWYEIYRAAGNILP